jgi:hypothetical protein
MLRTFFQQFLSDVNIFVNIFKSVAHIFSTFL